MYKYNRFLLLSSNKCESVAVIYKLNADTEYVPFIRFYIVYTYFAKKTHILNKSHN